MLLVTGHKRLCYIIVQPHLYGPKKFTLETRSVRETRTMIPLLFGEKERGYIKNTEAMEAFPGHNQDLDPLLGAVVIFNPPWIAV